MFVFLLLHRKGKTAVAARSLFAVFAMRALHPVGVLPGRRICTAAQPAQEGSAGAVIDVRMFTVGPVQENCYIVRPRGRRRVR